MAKSPDAECFPLSIAEEGAEVTLLPSPTPKFFSLTANPSVGAGEENEVKISKKNGALKGRR
jgi:hypothetical protein